MWKATSPVQRALISPYISIHAFRVEGDFPTEINGICCFDFNPRLPCGRRPTLRSLVVKATCISIHAFRVEGDLYFYSKDFKNRISIHAFRVEGDIVNPPDPNLYFISIHAFRVEGDKRFWAIVRSKIYFNPRLPCGRRRTADIRSSVRATISIHAFRMEGDRTFRRSL